MRPAEALLERFLCDVLESKVLERETVTLVMVDENLNGNRKVGDGVEDEWVKRLWIVDAF